MTAPRPHRRQRPVRAARRDPRAALVPPADVRRRRGPKPPDAIVAHLAAVLEREIRVGVATRTDGPDDTPPPPPEPEEDRQILGAAWLAALALALGRLVAHARRGVVGALSANAVASALARTAPVTPPAGAADVLTQAIESAVRERRGRPDATVATLVAAAVTALTADILRLHAALVMAIARAAGAARYVWTTQRDDRVRQLHRELEGTLQRWDAPPLAGLPDFHGHPGEAAGPCRCMAYPVVG